MIDATTIIAVLAVLIALTLFAALMRQTARSDRADARADRAEGRAHNFVSLVVERDRQLTELEKKLAKLESCKCEQMSK